MAKVPTAFDRPTLTPKKQRPLVIIESPFTAPTLRTRVYHRNYLLAAMRDSIDKGEAPFASHMIYTQVLDDDDPNERHLGITCGFQWTFVADLVAVYSDLGISGGMKAGIDHATRLRKTIEYRTLGWERFSASD